LWQRRVKSSLRSGQPWPVRPAEFLRGLVYATCSGEAKNFRTETCDKTPDFS